MKNNIKIVLLSTGVLLLGAAGCKKGYLSDINSPNPNQPSDVPPRFILSGALNQSAVWVENGFTDFCEYWMGYWAPSGDYIPDQNLLRYNVTTDFGAGNWNTGFLTLGNYKKIIDVSTDPKQANTLAIAKIMWAFHYQRLVDMYNNLPYSQAFQSGNLFPGYDDASAVYTDIVAQLDGALSDIAGAPADAENPGTYDIMFKGNMSNWQKLANSLKLRIFLHTNNSAGIGAIDKSIGFLTVDAAVNPGYANTADNKQNPKWNDIGFDLSNQERGGHKYNRANSYAVDFYKDNNDTRLNYFYALNDYGEVQGRAFGSADGGSEHNDVISAISSGVYQGTGVLKSATMAAILLPATEIYFMRAEATQRGYLTGGETAEDLYNSAVTESFKLLDVGRDVTGSHYQEFADAYLAQTDVDVNFASATDKIKLILTQEWAALNSFDPIEAWSTWRRTGIPSDLPISVYPGVSAPHIPYRLQYPTSEYSYNAANAKAQGTIDPITSKIFWMP